MAVAGRPAELRPIGGKDEVATKNTKDTKTGEIEA